MSSASTSSSPTPHSMSSSPTSFTLITFNAYLFPTGMRHSCANPNKYRRGEEIVKRMHTTTKKGVTNGSHSDGGPNTARVSDSDDEDEEEEDELVLVDSLGDEDHRSAIKQRRINTSSHTSAVVHPALSPSPSPSAVGASPSSLSSSTSTSSYLSSDILCLQEVLGSVWCSHWQRYFRSSLSLEYHLLFNPLPSLCRGVLFDGGLLIASRYEIVHSDFRAYKNSSNVMRLAEKGFLHAVVDLDRKKNVTAAAASSLSSQPHHPRRLVHIINTHLHPHEASFSEAHGCSVRRAQVEEVYSYLLSTQDDTELSEDVRFDPDKSALIMTGDLNTVQGSVECEAIRRITRCTHYSSIPHNEPTMHTSQPFCNHPVDQIICGDYAIGNQQVKLSDGRLVRDAKELSDHYPVQVEFQLV